MKRALFILMFAALVSGGLTVAPAAWAGVVLTDAEGGQSLLSDGRFKNVDDEGQTFIFDSGRGTMMIIDDERQVYAEGTPDEFCASGSSMMEQAMAGMSPEERAMMEQMMGSMKRESPGDRPEVKIRREGGGKLAGYDTVKYVVVVDGRPYEELWLSDAGAIMDEFADLHEMVELTARMGECFGGSMGMAREDFVESDPAYIALFKKGYPLKTVSLEDGVAEVDEEIVKVESRSIPDSEFRAPAGYRQVSFQQLMAGE